MVRHPKKRDSNLEANQAKKNLTKSEDKDNSESPLKKVHPLSSKPPRNDSQQPNHEPELNSFKFARPRIYVQNSYESADISALDHLKYVSTNVGPKGRTPAYNHFLDRQLQLSRPKSGKKDKNREEVSLNNIDFSSPTLKLANLKVEDLPIKALVDTGSTHCLMSLKAFQKLAFHTSKGSYKGSWKCAK